MPNCVTEHCQTDDMIGDWCPSMPLWGRKFTKCKALIMMDQEANPILMHVLRFDNRCVLDQLFSIFIQQDQTLTTKKQRQQCVNVNFWLQLVNHQCVQVKILKKCQCFPILRSQLHAVVNCSCQMH